MDRLGTQTARIARLQGMVAGTPFYLALVPGYMNYLWQEARMNLRLAALYGRDPGICRPRPRCCRCAASIPRRRTPRPGCSRSRTWASRPSRSTAGRCGCGSSRPAAARVRRVHRASERRAAPRRARAGARRRRGRDVPRPVGDHVDLPGDVHDHDGLGLRDPLPAAVPAHARVLCHRGAAPEQRPPEPGRGWRARVPSGRQAVSAAGLALSIAIPAGFLAYAIHVHKKFGITWVTAVGLLVALSVVTAAAVYGSRR